MSNGTQSKSTPALIGGAALGVASSIPVLNLANCACCALVIGGGVLAAYLYMKDAPPAAKAPLGDGLILGLMAGGVGAVVATVISIPLTFLASSFGMSEVLEQALESTDIPEPVRDILETLGAGGFSIGFIFIRFILTLVVYGIFATIGGLIGVAIFNKKPVETTPAAPPPTAPTPSA